MAPQQRKRGGRRGFFNENGLCQPVYDSPIERMINGDALANNNEGQATTTPLRVMVVARPPVEAFSQRRCSIFLPVIICDRNFHVENASLLLTEQSFPFPASNRCTEILVKGYVTSLCNVSHPLFLAITSFDVKKENVPLPSPFPTAFKPKRSTHVPSFSKFLAVHVPHLVTLTQDFFLKESLPTTATTAITWDSIVKVSNFLKKHAAKMTLASTAAGSDAVSPMEQQQYDFYQSALRSFRDSQMDRQTTSLQSHTGKETIEMLAMINNNHQAALLLALTAAADNKKRTTPSLTPTMLKQWHKTLCEGQLTNAGEYRTKNVRAGLGTFCTPSHVDQALEQACQSLHSLTKASSAADPGYRAVLLAAAVLFAVVDVHPFSDGNGRLSRIACNWCLRTAGIPFCINLAASPDQRRDYIAAIREARRNFSLVQRGYVRPEYLQEAQKEAGFLNPLIVLVADRLSKALHEFEEICQEKERLATQELEEKYARMFRERAAMGNCLICFDEKPDIATLCCGKAVHLRCMAQWLSSNSSCPQCRGALPQLHQRPAPQPARQLLGLGMPSSDVIQMIAQQLVNGELTVDATTEDSENQQEEEEPDQESTSEEEVEDSFTEEEEISDTTSFIEEEVVRCRNCSNIAAKDCANGCCGRCCSANGGSFCARHNVEEEDDTYSTTSATSETTASPPQQHYYCLHGVCRNRAASDCSNSYCGRCCALHGIVGCVRHHNL